MKMLSSVGGALETIPSVLIRGLEKLEIRGRTKIIQTKALRSAIIVNRVLEAWGYSDSNERQSTKDAEKKILAKNNNYKLAQKTRYDRSTRNW